MRGEEKQPQFLRMVCGEDILDGDEISERFGHLFGLHGQKTIMDPPIREIHPIGGH